MEVNRVYSVIVRIVVLEKMLWAHIENFDFFVCAARSEATSIRMKTDSRNHALVVHKGVNICLIHNIPQFNSAIVWAWCNHSAVMWKLGASYPVGMAGKRLDEFFLFDVPHFYELVVTWGDKQTAIWIKRNWLAGGWVTFKNFGFSTCVVGPNANGRIPPTRCDNSASLIYCNVGHRAFVALKPVRASIGSEPPSQNDTIIRTRDDLLQTRVKNRLWNSFLMTL